MNHRRRSLPGIRRGVLTLTVMICLMLVTALSVSWVKTLVLERRAVETRQQRMEAEILARSALARGAAKARADERYDGETWQVEPNELGGRQGAAVTIQVERSSDQPEARLIRVVARFPDRPGAGAERRDELQISIKKARETP